jgi:PAS domain S-box-containing protein
MAVGPRRLPDSDEMTGSPVPPDPQERSLLNDLDAVVWEADAETMTFTFVSAGVRDLLGYSPYDWLEEPGFWFDHLHPEDRERVVSVFVRVAAEGGGFDHRYRLRDRNGRWVTVRDLGHAVSGPQDRPSLVRGLLVAQPAYTGVPAGTEEESSDRRFERVVERLPAIVYLEAVEPDEAGQGRMLYVSPQVQDLLGFTPDEWLGDPGTWARQFHPEDRPRIQQEYERVEETGEPLHLEYRMFTREGEIRWFRDEAVLVRDAEGEPRYWQGIMFDVTREREAQERERVQEERYRELIAHIPAIAYEESDGARSVYVSPRVQETLGISAEDWTPQAWLQRIHPDDRAAVTEALSRESETGEARAFEYRVVADDGTVAWFRDEAAPVRNERGDVVSRRGVLLDITGRKEAEAQLAEAEARYRVLVEQIPAITYIDPVDVEGPTAYISPQTEELLGYSPQDWYEDRDLWSKLVHPEDRDRLEAQRAAGDTASSYRLLAKDGHVVWVHDRSQLIRGENGEPRYWQGVLVDVTEHHRVEELARDLEMQRVEAERLRMEDQMKSTFLQAVSHDLRTPLAAILGLAVTLERDDLTLQPEEVRDMAARIAVNARRLDGLVGDFLDLERLSRGAATPNLEPLDIGALTRELVANSELVAERRLALDVAPATIRADVTMVERIVENLLGNTVKHTPGDSRIWVRLEREEEGVLLVVEDDGPGVPAEDRERVFEPFRQGRDPGAGTGVGLALVARFAELHGGRAWVEERPGGGASFRVLLAWDPPPNGEEEDEADDDQAAAEDPSADNHA